MDQRQKRYILENIDKKPVEKIAQELNIRERKIHKFLKRHKEKSRIETSGKEKRSLLENKKIFLSILLIAALGFILYANSLEGQFVWDDAYLIKNNIYIRNWQYIPEIFTKDIAAGAQTQSNFYRPLQILSYLFDHSLWGLDVKGYHLTNILLHIFVALSVYWLVNLLFGNNPLSLFTSLLFIAHPLHTEAVTYMSGRADLLAGLFMVLSLIFYIKSYSSERMILPILTLATYILALLSRESPLIMPLILLLYHYTFSARGGSASGGKTRPKVERFIPIVVAAIVYIMLRFTYLKSLMPHTIVDTTIFQRIPGFLVAITEYIRLLFLPFGLHMEYGNKLFDLTDPKALLGAGVLIAMLICAYKNRGSSRLVFFSITWFLLTLLPQSNIYPINAYMAEHWLYLPSIGAFLLLANTLSALYSKKEFRIIIPGLALFLLAFFSYLTIKQNIHWREPIAFYKRTLQYTPDSFRAHNSLGIKYDQMGDREKAIASYKKAIECNPNFIYPYHNLATVYAAIGEAEEAIRWYEKAMEISPRFGGTYFNLGNLYGKIGKPEDAIASYKKAIELYPEYLEAYFNLGNTYKSMERYEEAIATYKRAIEIDPNDNRTYNNLGNTYSAMGKPREAIESYEKAIKIAPDEADAYNNMGALYSYGGEDQKAMALFRKAIEVDPGHALTYNNIAVMYFDKKEFDEAIGYCDKAVSLGGPDPALLKALKPYRKAGNE